MLPDRPEQRRVDRAATRRAEHIEEEAPAYRFAGQIFGIDNPARTKNSPHTSPKGVGFGVGDGYGPDDDYDSVEPLSSTLDPTYYRSYRSV